MTKLFNEYVSTVLEKCWKGYTQKGMKKKGKKTVPNCVEEGYFEVEPDFQKKLSNAVAGKKIKLKKWGLLTEIDANRNDIQEILKNLKNQGVITFYQYPVEEIEKILVFKNVQDVKRLLRSDPNALQGFVKY
jgi:hypothetical protein